MSYCNISPLNIQYTLQNNVAAAKCLTGANASLPAGYPSAPGRRCCCQPPGTLRRPILVPRAGARRGALGKVLLKQKVTLTHDRRYTLVCRYTRSSFDASTRGRDLTKGEKLIQIYTHVDLTSIFGVQYSSPGSPCGCSMRASRFSRGTQNKHGDATA